MSLQRGPSSQLYAQKWTASKSAHIFNLIRYCQFLSVQLSAEWENSWWFQTFHPSCQPDPWSILICVSTLRGTWGIYWNIFLAILVSLFVNCLFLSIIYFSVRLSVFSLMIADVPCKFWILIPCHKCCKYLQVVCGLCLCLCVGSLVVQKVLNFSNQSVL